MRKLIYISLFVFISSFTWAQGVNVKAWLDSTRILVGQELQLHLEAEFAAQDTILWPALSDTISKNIEILSTSKIDTSFDEHDVTIKRMMQNINITSFDSGYFPIPPIKFTVNGHVYESEPLLIQVLDVPVDTAKGIFDIKEPYEVPFSFAEWLEYNWHWIALGVGIILLAIGLYFYFKKRKEKPVTAAPAKPKVPPHKTALKKLNDLEQKRLWQNGKLKAYHSELSDIIREYIEDRFNINALEQTSWETLESLKHTSIEKTTLEKLQQTFTISDMVKFAKEMPVASENEMCLKHCIDFVNQTTETNQPKENE